jgi:hypothetical protein
VRQTWQISLAVGLLSIAGLFVLTFVQPAIWLRILVDAALITGAVYAARIRLASTPTPAKLALANQ